MSAAILELSRGRRVPHERPALVVPAKRGRNQGLMLYVVEDPRLIAAAQRADMQKASAEGWRVVISPNWDAAQHQMKIYLEDIGV